MAGVKISQGLKLLREPNVNRMFVAYLISYTGTAMAPIAMAFGVLELTGSAADAAIVIAAPTAASIVVLLFGGVIADRTSRQRVIYIADTVSAIAQIGMAYLFLSGAATVPSLTLLMLINGCALAFHTPAATGLIIQLVDRKDLQATNALLGTARNGAFAGGAALGGILVATFGAGWTLAFDGLTFFVSAALVFSLQPRAQVQEAAASLFADLKAGWREFTAHTWLWTIVLQFSLIVAAGEAIFGLVGPAIAKDMMGGARDWGFIAAGFGVGTLIGGLIGMRVSPTYPMRFAVLLVLLFAGVEVSLLGPLPVPAVATAAAISGIAGQTFAVLWYTTLQIKVPEHMLSRVSAYDHLGSIGLAPLGLLVGGWLYETYGYRPTLMLAISCVVLPVFMVLCIRDVRMMRHDVDTSRRIEPAG